MSKNKEVVPCFEAVDDLCNALEQKGAGTAIDLYPRDGTSNLYALEQRVANLSGNDANHTTTYNSGMSAVADAVEVGVERSAKDRPVIAYAGEAYAKTLSYIGRYAMRHGLRAVAFDSGDNEDIQEVVERERPDVIVTETVSNGPNMPVLDHEFLLDVVRDKTDGSTLVLDHTLPLSTGYRITDDIDDEDGVIVVESGTKSYGLNNELLGITFCKNEQIRQMLQQLRCERGSLPSVGGTERLIDILPASREEFDQRNNLIYQNTQRVARAVGVYVVERDLPFYVHHPALDSHKNKSYAKAKNNGNVAPVFYIQPFNARQIEFAKKLAQNTKLTDIAKFGQSFGFDDTRILPDLKAPYVRVAPGAEIDPEQLIEQLTISLKQ